MLYKPKKKRVWFELTSPGKFGFVSYRELCIDLK